ncbi:23242_t:CDS:2, partial [Gigaspora margarita]
DGNHIIRYNGYRQKNTKEEKCTIKMNKETETYKLVVNCKKGLRAEIEDIKKLIDQEVINERGRKILSVIINEMDKKRDQKAEFWVKISRSSKEKMRDIQLT